MDNAAKVHFNLLLALFQLAAAIAIVRLGRGHPLGRAFAALVLTANAVISLAVSLRDERSPDSWGLAAGLADYPTPELIALVVLWCPGRRFAGPIQWWLTSALVATGIAAMALSPWQTTSTFVAEWFGHGAVMTSYALAIGAYARDVVRSPSWESEWLLAAFTLRGGDFAVRYTLELERPSSFTPYLLLGVFAISAAVVLAHRRVPRGTKILVGTAALVGAILGGIGRFAASDFASFQESLITLALGRPALMVVALVPPGSTIPFFKGSLVGAAAYASAAALSGLLGMPRGVVGIEIGIPLAVSSAFLAAWWRVFHAAPPVTLTPAAPPGTLRDWERILLHLAAAAPGTELTRKDLAAALGILPRNIQRGVDAANRSTPARPGLTLVDTAYRRGSGGQLQYHYVATPHGREVAAAIQPERERSTEIAANTVQFDV